MAKRRNRNEQLCGTSVTAPRDAGFPLPLSQEHHSGIHMNGLRSNGLEKVPFAQLNLAS